MALWVISFILLVTAKCSGGSSEWSHSKNLYPAPRKIPADILTKEMSSGKIEVGVSCHNRKDELSKEGARSRMAAHPGDGEPPQEGSSEVPGPPPLPDVGYGSSQDRLRSKQKDTHYRSPTGCHPDSLHLLICKMVTTARSPPDAHGKSSINWGS